MAEINRQAKRSKKLISMLGEEEKEEEEEDCLQLEVINGNYSRENDDYSDETMMKRSTTTINSLAVVPMKRGSDDGGGGGDHDEIDGRRRRKKERVNPKDYPLLGKFLKQEVMADEFRKNWRVIDNENATILEREWGIIRDKIIEQSIVKMDLIIDIYSSITIKDGSDND